MIKLSGRCNKCNQVLPDCVCKTKVKKLEFTSVEDDNGFIPDTKESNPLDLLVSVILADFGNLLIDIMGSRKCSIGSLENYYDLHLEVKRISELYSKLQEYFTVSQKSR